MAPIAIVFGVLLTARLVRFFFLSEKPSPTAFIPSGFGLALIVCGMVARNERFRMHAMHFAAVLGLIGFAIPAVMVALVFVRGNNFESVKHGGQSAMAVLCLVFLGLCVKSFIDVRAARKKREAEAAPPA